MSSSPNPKQRAGRRSSPGRRRRNPHKGLALEVLSDSFAVCRLAPDAEIPSWALGGRFSSISKSPDELSVVCDASSVPQGVTSQLGWRAIKVAGPMDLELIGVMAALALPLARAKVSLFAVSTYDTDYLLIREENLERAAEALRDFGHRIRGLARPGAAAEERPVSKANDEAPAPRPVAAPAPEEAAPAETAPDKRPAEETGAEPVAKKTKPRRVKSLAPAARKDGASDRDKSPVRFGPLPGAPESREKPGAPEPGAPEPGAPEPGAPEQTAPQRAAPAPGRFEAARRPGRRGPEDVTSDGLYTGAIPQHPVETTEELFSSLGLSEPILRTVSELGFEHPTPIQAGVIPQALAGKDIVGLAETGSGKTAAFSLPLAERLTHGRGVRGLILCPTREIALQTQAFLGIFGRDHELETAVVIGGVRMSPQIQALKRGPDIIVATPGRLADHMRRRNVRLDKIEHLILDEADHMLDLGFLPQIKEILEQVPEKRQTMMFSATMPPPIERLSQQFMSDPVRVDFRPVGHTAAGMEHRVYLVKDDEDRRKCLVQLLREEPGSTLIFVRRKLHTEWLARQLELAGFPVERIHSDRSQGQRVNALRGFREGQHEILVATDVAARGIDVPGIRHVINFGLPEAVEDYVHRAGRTARGSAKGIVSSVGIWTDKEMVRQIELAIGQKLTRCSVEGVEPYRELKPRRTVRRRRLL